MATPLQVIVYIITQNPRGDATKNVKRLFQNQLFHIHRLSIDDNNLEAKNVNEETRELAHITGCLRHSKENFPNHHFIIIKDTSVSVAGSDKIASAISKCINMGGWDVFYLCEWQERCDLLNNFTSLDDSSGLSAAKTNNAKGIQALLISPEGREMLLGDKPLRNGKIIQFEGNVSNTLASAVEDGAVLAQTTIPNIINYDITQATVPRDFLKGAQCAPPPGVTSYQQTGLVPIVPAAAPTSGTNWWLWIIVMIIIIIIIIAIVAYWRRKKAEDEAIED